jgi:hypothetical protein
MNRGWPKKKNEQGRWRILPSLTITKFGEKKRENEILKSYSTSIPGFKNRTSPKNKKNNFSFKTQNLNFMYKK